jgi:predicted HTH transcriptional regulator
MKLNYNFYKTTKQPTFMEQQKSIETTKEVSKSFTKKEIENYIRQQDSCKFKSPEEEYLLWAKTQTKTCTKCLVEKKLCDFKGNTSGRDAFDKSGYRLRRPECSDCTKKVGKGKNEAVKKAKELGIAFTAPEGTLCAVCNKPPTSGNCIVFDHCHETNQFRGYCCNSCNRSVGVLGDNVDGLLRVLNYLNKTEKCILVQNENRELVKK